MSEALRVTTLNLNGVRAAHRRGLPDFLAAARPDVLLAQEVRAPADIAAALLGDDWEVIVHPSQIKGRAGVAIAVRRSGAHYRPGAVRQVRAGLPGTEEPVDSGRWLETDVHLGRDLTLVSTYLHSGGVGTPKQDAKMAHLPRVEQRLAELRAAGRPVLVAGDFNVVRSERDIKNWRGNHNKSSGVLDEEIAYLNRWATGGWRDVVRQLAGETQGPYTWWSWRGKAFDNDAGWRIDYQFVTEPLAARARSYAIFRDHPYDQRLSDHAPVTVTYQW